jgi:tetratricopeptide (TPR) repeat protein
MRSTRYVLSLLIILVLIGCASASAQKKKSAKNDEANPQYQYEKGVVALNYGLTDEAIRYGNLAISLDPNHYNGHRLLGNAYYQKGDYAQAVAAFEKAVALRPDQADGHFGLGLALFETGALDRAAEEFGKSRAIKEDPNTGFYLARVYFNQKKFDEALGEIEKSLKKNPGAPGFYNLKGVILNQLGRYAEAAGSFQAGLVLAPEDVNIQVNLGIAYINSGEPNKARAVFEKALPQLKDPELKAKIESYLKSIKAPGGRA